MRIAVFSTCSDDQEFLDLYNTGHDLVYFPQPLTMLNVSLTRGFEVLCIFVNDKADRQVMAILKENGATKKSLCW